MTSPFLQAAWPMFAVAAAAAATGYAIASLRWRRRSSPATLTDIDDIAALEAARLAEEKYRAIFENAVEGIFQTTPQGKYLSANPRLAKIYGYPSADVLMNSLQNIERQLYVDPERRCEFARLMEQHDELRDFESEIFRRDGSVIWISENARAIRDRAGRLLYYEGTVEDITARKQAVGWQAEKDAAVAASEAKSVFLAHMSHEIRTPLNGVIGMLQLLAQSSLAERESRFVQIARSSAENLLAIINDVLDFSKIEAGKLELEAAPFHLHELLEDVTELFSHRAHDQGLELSCHVTADVPAVVSGDVQRLRQVLINLVGNALKFTRQGQVALRAEPIETSADRVVIRFRVQDTGIGIPPERRNRLFTPFSQVDASTTRKFGGTGLGLAICRQIVELMKGRIDVESELGRGSMFWFEIPLQLAAAEPQTLVSHGPRQLAGLRVLAIDAQPASIAVLQELFGSWGMIVVDVPDFLAASERLLAARARGQSFALAVISHQPGERDGLEAATAIRQHAGGGGLPVLMLTSIDSLVDRGACERAGVSIVTKPIRQSRVYDLLATALHRPSASGEAAASDGKSRSQLEQVGNVSEGPESSTGAVRPRLLVAEDNDINQLVTNEILRSGGYDCDMVASGQQAITALRRGGYDLVLMDCHMPELDGLAATRRIRQLEAAGELPHAARGAIPIIALTANAVQGDREQCLAAGMSGYATKPVDRDELLRKIAQFVRPEANPAVVHTTETPKPAEETPLDMQSLLDRCSGDEVFAQRLLVRFRERLPQSYEEIVGAVERCELTEARRLAHTLRGTAANLGANGVRSAAAQLEASLSAEANVEIPRRLADLERETEQCLDRLDAMLTAERTAL